MPPLLEGSRLVRFSWYVANGVYPNLALLAAALLQAGPWHDQRDLPVDGEWLLATLKAKITSIDWPAAAADVNRFLRPVEAKSLSLWSERFFQAKLDRLAKDSTN